MSPTEASPPRVRADIQVLRAVAVLLVVVSHAWPTRLPGGFVGVDVFFVISGYLVAGRLLDDAAHGNRPAILAFLGRRIRRILPAASVVAVLTAAVFSLVLDPLESGRYLGDATAALLFVANFRAESAVTGYFSVVDPSPLRHYWSLGVEEQFYLLLPLLALVCALFHLRRRTILAILVVVGAASFVAGAWLARFDATYAFYMLPPRVWEFCVGAIAALLPGMVGAAGPGRARHRWTVAVLGTVGAVLMAVSIRLLTPESLVPGLLVVPAVVGTSLLLYAGRAGLACRQLWWAPARWLGDRSYALYLTHWPPLTWLLIRTNGASPERSDTLAALAVAVGSAALLHALVERPLYRGDSLLRWSARRRTITSVTLVAAGAVAVTAVVPAMVRLHSDRVAPAMTVSQVERGVLTNPGFVSADVQPDLVDSRVLNALYQGCHGAVEVVEAHACGFGPGDAPSIVVVGDSHAASWYDSFRAAYPDERIAFVTHTSCPLYDLDPDEVTDCDRWRDSALDVVLETRPALTVLSNYTSGYISGLDPADAPDFDFGWRETLTRLSPLDRVVVLGDVPSPPFDPPRCLARNVDHADVCDFEAPPLARQWDLLERSIVESTSTQWVDTASWLCADVCASLAGNVAVWRDSSGHLTPAASRLLAPRLLASLADDPSGATDP